MFGIYKFLFSRKSCSLALLLLIVMVVLALPARSQTPQWKETESMLNNIRLHHVSFEHQPLDQVLAKLTTDSQNQDPEKIGVRFLLATNDSIFTNIPIVNIPSLSDVRLADLLNALVLAADQKICYQLLGDGTVMFYHGKTPPQLVSRVYRMDLDGLVATLKQRLLGNSLEAISSTNSLQTLKNYIMSFGVDFQNPPGKSIFYNDHYGKLFVKATATDLEKIESILHALDEKVPAVHIKARFISVPKGTVASLGRFFIQSNRVEHIFTGILYGTNNSAVIHSLENRTNVEWIAEPETTIRSDRRMPLHAGCVMRVKDASGSTLMYSNFDLTPLAYYREFGPAIEVRPTVLTNGYTLKLSVTLSHVDHIYTAANNDEWTKDQPSSTDEWTKPVTWQSGPNTLNVWDNQSVVIGGPDKDFFQKLGTSNGSIKRSPADGREFLLIITPTIVNPLGNRVYKDEDLPFAQKSFPSQPTREN